MKYLRKFNESFADADILETCREILYPLTDDGNNVFVNNVFEDDIIIKCDFDREIYNREGGYQKYYKIFKSLFIYLNSEKYTLSVKSKINDLDYKYILKFIETGEIESNIWSMCLLFRKENLNDLKENYKSDALGYNIGDYVYHVSPEHNHSNIMTNGFLPKDGIAINKKKYKNRLYLATSLIAAYDLSVGFGAWRETSDDYLIYKIDSTCIKNYEEDPLFQHGIYIDYKIDSSYIIDVINADDLFNSFDDDDIEALY